MTEEEWMECKDSGRMFKVFGGMFGTFRLDPRLRRYAVECCRRVRHLIIEDVFRAAADAGEAFADDPHNLKGTIKTMSAASWQATQHLRHYSLSASPHQVRAAKAATATCSSFDLQAGHNASQESARAVHSAVPNRFSSSELRYQAKLLRCLFGLLPFRPVSLNPKCLTPTVLAFAQAIYDDRDFAKLPMLADLLEESGCDQETIMKHVRGGGDHVRGCFALDLVLGKS